MSTLLILFALLAPEPAPRGAIDAAIRGTTQSLEIHLLLRDDRENWTPVAKRVIAPETRQVRFDALAPGIYQLLVRGAQPTEQLATKVVLGRNDRRRLAIDIVPADLTGRVTHGGAHVTGALILRHKEFRWGAAIALAEDGTFRAPLWQRGAFLCTVRGPALATPYRDSIEITGASPPHIAIAIPDGRITGVVRDSKSGAAIAEASVFLNTKTEESETTWRAATNGEGRFEFSGVKNGRHTVRVVSPLHLDGEPAIVALDSSTRLRQLDLRLARGRTVPVVVVNHHNQPVADAVVFVVAGSKLCSRTFTDEHGRTNVAAPHDEEAALFVVPLSGAFGVQSIARRQEEPLRVSLPRESSSLLIHARTTAGAPMPQFSLLMRYNGTLVPPPVSEELAELRGLRLATTADSDVVLQNIPSGSYEFWPYRNKDELESIVAAADVFAAPIHVQVRTGENKVAVKFAAR